MRYGVNYYLLYTSIGDVTIFLFHYSIMKSMTRKRVRLNKKGGLNKRSNSRRSNRGRTNRRSSSSRRTNRRSSSNRSSSSSRRPSVDTFSNIKRDYGQFSDRDFVPSSDPTSFSNIKNDYGIWEEDDFSNK